MDKVQKALILSDFASSSATVLFISISHVSSTRLKLLFLRPLPLQCWAMEQAGFYRLKLRTSRIIVRFACKGATLAGRLNVPVTRLLNARYGSDAISWASETGPQSRALSATELISPWSHPYNISLGYDPRTHWRAPPHIICTRRTNYMQRETKVKVVTVQSYPRTMPWTPIGLWDVEDLALSTQSAHRWW
jgi:hypothetical protein